MKKIKENGITLIALVITIVVLIILAAVAINISLGNNGIFNRAKTGKELYQNAEVAENDEIAKSTNYIENMVAGTRQLSNISYSTEEQDTGLKWVDGKNIYQRTLQFTTPTKTSTTSSFIICTNYIQCDYMVNMYGVMLNENNDYIHFSPVYSSYINCFYRKSTQSCYYQYLADASWAYNKTAYITFQYTKLDS